MFLNTTKTEHLINRHTITQGKFSGSYFVTPVSSDPGVSKIQVQIAATTPHCVQIAHLMSH